MRYGTLVLFFYLLNQGCIIWGMILVGTSGYDHPELRGVFYPEKLPRKDFLLFYSTRFDACEINSTFYGMPDSKRMISFYERSEGRVKFSVKMTRTLTHEIDRNWKEQADDFREACLSLAEKDSLSSVLVQFPESFHYTVENRFYLANLLKSMEPLLCVVEFRHKEWIKPSVFEGLAARNTGIVFCDMPQLKNLPDGFSSGTPFIGKNAYIRLHGRNAQGWYAGGVSSKDTVRYDYEYSENELRSFIPVVKQAENEGRVVQVYFNNHPKGTGFLNAISFKQMLNSPGC